ncbi:MAG: YHYH protein [Pseudomonadota bacterium]
MRFGVAGALAVLVGVMTGGGALAHDVAQAQSQHDEIIERLTAHFEPGAIIGEPGLVDCTLSGGTETTCVSITVGKYPTGYDVGPWCPRNIADGPELSGIWLDQGVVYDADGAFIANLATFYDDDTWQLYDPATGDIKVTDTRETCAAAARPDVDPDLYNHCVECEITYLPDDFTITVVIPVEPVKASEPAPLGGPGAGLAFNGVRLDKPAPLDAILSAHTLAPFDDCGGHVNLNAGYHIHAVTDCLKEVAVEDGHAPMLGIAMDGYALFAELDANGREPQGLDACRGHHNDVLGYHYHVADPGQNQILGCLTGEFGCSFHGESRYCDATRQPR